MRLDRAILINARGPSFFVGKLELTGNCMLTVQESECFYDVLCLMREAILRDKLVIKYQTVVYFTDADKLLIDVSMDYGTLGWYGQAICYHVFRWRRDRLDERKLKVVMLEELCHCFYQSGDHDFIEPKVTEILQARYPGVTRADLYEGFRVQGTGRA